MLEDDLKISSDEEEGNHQTSPEKSKAHSSALSVSRSGDHSSGASGSSSESESSSESDSDSESSSTDSECNPASATPEPEPPSTNKWQLDKWLNKVTPQNKPPVVLHSDVRDDPGSTQGNHSLCPEKGPQTAGAVSKTKPPSATTNTPTPTASSIPAQSAEAKDTRGALCPVGRDKVKPKVGQKGSESQRSKVRSPGLSSGSEVAAPRRSTGKKQPRRMENSNCQEDSQKQAWSRPMSQPSQASTEPSLGSSQPREREHLQPPSLELSSRPRTKASAGKTAPRKEPRSSITTTTTTSPASCPCPAPRPALTPAASTIVPGPIPTLGPGSGSGLDRKKQRGPNSKIVPKSKEFIETESSSSSSECHSDPEEMVKIPPPLPLLPRLSNSHPPPLPPPPLPPSYTVCAGASMSGGRVGVFGGKGIRVRDRDSSMLANSSLASNSNSSTVNCSNTSGTNSGSTVSISSQNSSCGHSAPDPGWSGGLCEELFPMSPALSLCPGPLLSPLDDPLELQSLWVKIELSLLSRVPGQGGSSAHGEAVNGSKKLRLNKDPMLLPPCISPIHNQRDTSTKDCRKQKREEKALPPLLSPLSEEPPQKRRVMDSSSSLIQDAISSSLPTQGYSSSPSSSSHRHRRGDKASHPKASIESDAHMNGKTCGGGFHANGKSDPNLWSDPLSLAAEYAESGRPKLSFKDTVHSADYYMLEAKKLKHKADGLIRMEKFGKAVNYADGALSFIECGNAMERDPLEAKSPYTMYSETVDLIRYAMRLKNFTSHSATLAEKKLAVLCNRCLSLLYLRMFRLKKDHAVKYSRSLMDYFKNSAKGSQAPSPWGANGKSTGTPSPLSLSPSPVSSVSSSSGGAAGGGGGGGGGGGAGNVAIPQRIHHMAASHVNITNNILRSYEHWDTAERLASESPEFFAELDLLMDPLSQQSTMVELVRYTRQGLHWLRTEAHLL
ncbi:AF4/FMR2 family member 2 [Aplochiton taeniatus]